MNDRHDENDAAIGPSGTPFPGEHEWLELPMPPGFAPTAEFADAAMQSCHDEELIADRDLENALRDALPTFALPTPSSDFVARTVGAIASDESRRWHDLLARHSAPEPSPEFVARTIAALADERSPAPLDTAVGFSARILRRAWPLFAIAAGFVLWLLFGDGPRQIDPFEARLVHAERRVFAHAFAPTALAAALTVAERDDDPLALPDWAPDRTWLPRRTASGGPR